jgi:hypothetical protein
MVLVIHLWAGGARRVELKAVHLWVSDVTQSRGASVHRRTHVFCSCAQRLQAFRESGEPSSGIRPFALITYTQHL